MMNDCSKIILIITLNLTLKNNHAFLSHIKSVKKQQNILSNTVSEKSDKSIPCLTVTPKSGMQYILYAMLYLIFHQ